ncbi:hypothetical protein Ahy_B09g098153 isoform A [Arachis hypogaea]|uniref:Uncharacterized protein n=1 Tax=Arachis hypogaea TaxID=3818 RepID=A0A444XQM9_ARAHY|nr:hypothetical protein Ahy_B09g098153 isoform A [Arachis hypogaea]
MEQKGKEATHIHQEQPRRATVGAKKQEELTAILHRAYDNIMVEMELLKAKRKGTSSLSHEDANLESVNELQSPPRIRTRGRPKNRLGSKLDKQIANATKKKKTKALNELNLFDAASVVHSNSSQYQGHVMNYQFRVPAAADNSLGPTITTNVVNDKQDEAHGRDNPEKDAEINFTTIRIVVRVMQGGVLTKCIYLGLGVCRRSPNCSSSFGIFGVFALPPSCVDAPSCVAASSWLESVKPRLNDGIGSVLGTYDAVRAIIISAAASSGAGLLRDHV